MTGYASELSSSPDSTTSAGEAPQMLFEVRSVNGRFLDLTLRLPDEMRHLEPALREAVARHVRRGKVELKVSLQAGEAVSTLRVSDAVLRQLDQWQSEVLAALPNARTLSVQEALHWSRQLQGSVRWRDESVMDVAAAVLRQLAEARRREGERLVAALQERIAQLRSLAARAEPMVPALVQKQQQRFLERWRDALAQAGASADTGSAQERALAEAAAHALRIDVAEELTRLRAHLDEIEAQLHKGGELGKRLDFLIQELHREANTLGSKSTALELSTLGVDMKVLIEQMREQVQNIE
ncbi:YicC/YloC family endoribonuclease [Inhella sp.]|uniref:YicC/YloC family endoribonuclease n=1 Tax=Inhella sp. TaxID=1921806 RepID=UPI0035B0328D